MNLMSSLKDLSKGKCQSAIIKKVHERTYLERVNTEYVKRQKFSNFLKKRLCEAL